MSIIEMKGVRVGCTPIFIPNLDKTKHRLLCKVIKQMPNNQTNIYDALFWGKSAEHAALVLKKGLKVDLEGHFICATCTTDDGTKVLRTTFVVHRLHLLKPTRVVAQQFHYDHIAQVTTGMFGNARIWITGVGFTGPVPIPKTH